MILRSILALFLLAAQSAEAWGEDLASSSSVPPASADAPAGRLDDSAIPQAYRLDLSIDPGTDRFSGTAEIDLTLKHDSSRIFLHGRDLDITSATALVPSTGRAITGQWQPATSSGGAYLVFAEPLPAGPAKLSITYAARINDGASGLFRVKVGADWYVWSQFEATDARSAFPGFDDPRFKTPFSITLRTPPGLKAISNSPELPITQENGQDVHRFAQTLPLPTYLVAMMVGPFTGISGEVPRSDQRPAPLPLRIIASQPHAERLGYPLESSREIVTRLESYFGEAFPFPKLDQIATPILPGAMENAGADLYQDGLLIVGKDSSVAARRRFGMIVSHELSHQWFGDLVTPMWWNDLWLNESFANWMGYRIGDAWEPDLNIAPGVLDEGFAAMDIDALAAGRPIRQPITSDAQIDAAFDAMTYGKGSHVITMFAGFIGDDLFRSGVRAYLSRHRYGSATAEDFFQALAEAAGNPAIVPAMQGFIDQQGVPLLTFTQQGKDLVVTQSRYAPLGSQPDPVQWRVPFCVRRVFTRLCHLLETPRARIIMPRTGLFVPNVDGAGYYRFELDDKQWDQLIKYARLLPAGEAMALADSLEASFRAGRSSIKRLVTLDRQLVRHPDSHASAKAMEALSNLSASGMIDASAQSAYQRFARRLYLPVLEKLGFDPRLGAYLHERPEQSEKRAQAVRRLASSARERLVINVLANAARGLMNGDDTALDPAWYDLALPIHVFQGGPTAARALIEKALGSQDTDFRAAAISAASRSGKEETARWLLDELKDERLRGSERGEMLRGVLEAPASRNFGYAWLKANLSSLLEGSVGVFFSARTPQMLDGFCSVADAGMLASDLRPRFAGRPAELELERTIERVRNCGLLRDARKAEVTEALLRLK